MGPPGAGWGPRRRAIGAPKQFLGYLVDLANNFGPVNGVNDINIFFNLPTKKIHVPADLKS